MKNKIEESTREATAIEQEVRELSIQKQKALHHAAKKAEEFLTENMRKKMDAKFRDIDIHVNKLLDLIREHQKESREIKMQKASAYKKLENLFNSFSQYQKMANIKQNINICFYCNYIFFTNSIYDIHS